MKTISKEKSISIIESFFEKIKNSTRNSKNEIKIEFFELKINDIIYERCDCAYLQNENQDEGILYDILMQRYFYIKSELVSETDKRYVPALFLLNDVVRFSVPKAIQDKMLLVLQKRTDENVRFEDFGTQFTLTKQGH